MKYLFSLLLFTAVTEALFAQQKEISSEFPFESKYIEVKGSNIHYIDEGAKDSEHTFLLLHGNPTSNYIWRNIVPYLSEQGRVIAPDLIGMGKSDKPDIDYTYQDHINYMDDFIESLDLENIVLVIQDWGSGIGFHYANRFRENVAGIVFLEGITRTISFKEMNFIERYLFKRMRHPEKGEKMLVKNNFFIKKFLPMMTKRKLTKEEKAYYASPYSNVEDRKAVRVWPTQIAIDGTPEESTRIISDYQKYLPNSKVPKLMFHAKPGVIIKMKEAEQIKQTWTNLDVVFLGKGKHYLQETHPHKIGEGIVEWYNSNYKNE